MSKEEKIKFEKDVDKKIKEIDNTMALEGMPLTKEIKTNIKNCLLGNSTTEKECQKVIERYKQIYG